MECIYLRKPGMVSYIKKEQCGIGEPYVIEEDVLSKYCKTDDFRECPRYLAYLETKKPAKKKEEEFKLKPYE